MDLFIYLLFLLFYFICYEFIVSLYIDSFIYLFIYFVFLYLFISSSSFLSRLLSSTVNFSLTLIILLIPWIGHFAGFLISPFVRPISIRPKMRGCSCRVDSSFLAGLITGGLSMT